MVARRLKGLILISLLSWLCCAPGNAADSTRRVHFLPVPTLGYAPETRLYAGTVVMMPFQISPKHRLSAAKLEVNFTQNRQRMLSASWDYYFGRDYGFSSGNILTARYPDYYWRPGSTTPQEAFTRYQAQKTDVQAEYLKRIGFNKIFAGAALRYASMQKLRYMEGDSGIWQGLHAGRVLGISLIGSHDSRDNLLNATKGMLLRWQGGVQRTGTGVHYVTHKLDSRWFFSKKHQTLALRLYVQTGSSKAPFFDLPAYGGDAARGYFTGRFRGERLAALQTEWRRSLGKRTGFTVFAGVGNAWMRHSGEAFLLKPNGGLGFRYLADRRAHVNLRFDYAFGLAGQRGFYVAFGEAF
jgi:hypothetical protein